MRHMKKKTEYTLKQLHTLLAAGTALAGFTTTSDARPHAHHPHGHAVHAAPAPRMTYSVDAYGRALVDNMLRKLGQGDPNPRELDGGDINWCATANADNRDEVAQRCGLTGEMLPSFAAQPDYLKNNWSAYKEGLHADHAGVAHDASELSLTGDPQKNDGYILQPGDTVLLRRPDPKSVAGATPTPTPAPKGFTYGDHYGHVATVISVDYNKGLIHVVAGNTGGGAGEFGLQTFRLRGISAGGFFVDKVIDERALYIEACAKDDLYPAPPVPTREYLGPYMEISKADTRIPGLPVQAAKHAYSYIAPAHHAYIAPHGPTPANPHHNAKPLPARPAAKPVPPPLMSKMRIERPDDTPRDVPDISDTPPDNSMPSGNAVDISGQGATPATVETPSTVIAANAATPYAASPQMSTAAAPQSFVSRVTNPSAGQTPGR